LHEKITRLIWSDKDLVLLRPHGEEARKFGRIGRSKGLQIHAMSCAWIHQSDAPVNPDDQVKGQLGA
jgi:ABC-type branched-subunit amino acid transport system substrate-binding protein